MSSVTYPFITLTYLIHAIQHMNICNHDEYMTIWLCAKQGFILKIMIQDYFYVVVNIE